MGIHQGPNLKWHYMNHGALSFVIKWIPVVIHMVLLACMLHTDVMHCKGCGVCQTCRDMNGVEALCAG
jgi:hypothetical protein